MMLGSWAPVPLLAACLLWAVASLVGFAAKDSATAQPMPVSSLIAQMEAALRTDIADAWFPRAVDQQEGGFLSSFSRRWEAAERQPKTIMFQARMTWVAAQLAMLRPEYGPHLKEAARHGADFLLRMWDEERGGFYWSYDGVARQPKHSLGVAYGIYALVAAGHALDDPALIAKAQEAFLWLDARGHDPINGGYFDALDVEGRPLAAPDVASFPTGPFTDSGGTPFGFKSLATQIHLLEAFTDLYRLCPDPLLRTRLAELLEIILEKAFVFPGTQHLIFTPDWQPLPGLLSFGYDVENATILVNAADALGVADDPAVWQVFRQLVDHALLVGWDNEQGGLFNEGRVLVGPQKPLTKIWWVQAESLNTLLIAHERFGASEATSLYWTRFVEQWAFIREHLIDAEYRGWFRQVEADGTMIPGAESDKGWQWKDACHEARALLRVLKRLERLGEIAPPAAVPAR